MCARLQMGKPTAANPDSGQPTGGPAMTSVRSACPPASYSQSGPALAARAKHARSAQTERPVRSALRRFTTTPSHRSTARLPRMYLTSRWHVPSTCPRPLTNPAQHELQHPMMDLHVGCGKQVLKSLHPPERERSRSAGTSPELRERQRRGDVVATGRLGSLAPAQPFNIHERFIVDLRPLDSTRLLEQVAPLAPG